MLQDISPMQFSNNFAIKEPEDDDLVFIFQGNKPLFYKKGEEKIIPTYKIIKKFFNNSANRLVYLFSADDTNAFLIRNSGKLEEENNLKLCELEDFSLEDITIFRSLTPIWHGFLGITASHLYKWYKYNKFCGHCGGEMSPSTKERSLICNDCGFTDFPKICPAVIVGVTNGDKILLTKYANRNFTRYALIAGFCEIGETIEETLHREVFEEAGVKIKNIRYYKSQPWGFSESLLLGFFADLDGDDTITMDEDELSEAVWATREEIPDDIEGRLSLTYTMMEAFKQRDVGGATPLLCPHSTR